jgi:hypothetical protein
MFPLLIQFGKYMFIIVYYVVKHKQILISMYYIYDFTKFSFYVIDKVGFVEVISKYIKNIYNYANENILIEILDVEKSEMGDFDIINI